VANFFPPRHLYTTSVGPILAPISAEAFRLWHVIRACTWQKDDAFLARTLDEADKVFAGFFGVSIRSIRRWRTELADCKLLVITTFASGTVSIRCSDPSDLADQQRRSPKVRELVAYRTFLSNSSGQICPITKEEELKSFSSSSSLFSSFNNQLNDNGNTATDKGAGQICPMPTPEGWTNGETPPDKSVHSSPQSPPPGRSSPQPALSLLETVDNSAIAETVALLTPLGFYQHVAERHARRLIDTFTPRDIWLIAKVILGECKGQVGLAAYQLGNLHPNLLRQKLNSPRAMLLEEFAQDDHSEVS
jgi:hypothetical protein